MAKALTVTTYARDHLPQIRPALVEVYGEVWGKLAPGDDFHSVEHFEQRLSGHASSPGWMCVAGEVDGGVIGYAYGRPDSVSEWQSVLRPVDPEVRDYGAIGTFGLCEIMVREPWRGKGIGHTIHNELMGTRPESRASLLVDSNRPKVRALYEHWGYQVVGQMQPFPDSPLYDAMVLDLR